MRQSTGTKTGTKKGSKPELGQKDQIVGKNVLRRAASPYLYCLAYVNGRRIRESLKIEAEPLTQEKLRMAEKKARLKLEALRNDDVAMYEAGRVTKSWPTVGQLLESFEEYAKIRNLSHRTRLTYRSALKNTILAVHGRTNGWKNRSVSDINPSLATKYVQAVIKDRPGAQDDRTERQSAVNMAQSRLRDAAAIFSRTALRYYAETGLRLPEINFGPSPYFAATRKDYTLPPAPLLKKTIEACEKAKDEEQDHYICFLLTFGLACRGSEAIAAEHTWIEETHEGGKVKHWLAIRERPTWKQKRRAHRKPMSDYVFAELQDVASDRLPLLSGETPHLRRVILQRNFATFLRGLGWDSNTYPCPVHELRKAMGNHVYHFRSPVAAKRLLGHSTILTTEQSYSENTETPPELVPLFERYLVQEPKAKDAQTAK